MGNDNVLYNSAFPRSNNYDADWIIDNAMVINPLWLTEWVCDTMDLKPGMRILDLGSGKSISSIFLAREFGVKVWSYDLWIQPTDNFKRVSEANPWPQDTSILKKDGGEYVGFIRLIAEKKKI